MNGTRRRRPAKQKQVSLFVALGLLLRRLLLIRVSWYIPALTPVCLFLLTHLLTLVTFLLIRNQLISIDEPVYASLVTWSVYGLIPLILSSYICFFLIARPAIGKIHRRFPQWSAFKAHLLNSGIYGASIGISLLALLQPGFGGKSLLLFFVGCVCGLGNWQLYRRLASVAPVSQQPLGLQEEDGRIRE